jgi:hypothetical protein
MMATHTWRVQADNQESLTIEFPYHICRP